MNVSNEVTDKVLKPNNKTPRILEFVNVFEGQLIDINK